MGRIAFRPMADFADYYREIYARGLGGETPAIPVAIADLEQAAAEAMDPKAANYVFAGAGGEGTMRRQPRGPRPAPDRAADAARRRRARSLHHRARHALPAPLLLAPIGVQKVVHEDGELATAGLRRRSGCR